MRERFARVVQWKGGKRPPYWLMVVMYLSKHCYIIESNGRTKRPRCFWSLDTCDPSSIKTIEQQLWRASSCTVNVCPFSSKGIFSSRLSHTSLALSETKKNLEGPSMHRSCQPPTTPIPKFACQASAQAHHHPQGPRPSAAVQSSRRVGGMAEDQRVVCANGCGCWRSLSW